jgi:putative endonuclease
MADQFYMYVLRSKLTGRLYVGSASDLEDRVHRHNTGQSKSTRHGVPWELIHQEAYPTRSEAVRREMYYKTGKGREELRRLLAANVV